MKFDLPVRVGEIRILADFPEPRLVLVLAEYGNFAYRVVPLSPCTAPASPREYELKGRVYQLWQTQTVGKAVLERSWLVERLAPEDFGEIERAQSVDRPAPLTPVERAQAVSLVPKGSGRIVNWRWTTASRLAASLLLVLGLATLVYNLYPSYTYTSKATPNSTAPVLTVHLAKEPTPIAPLEEPTEDLADESALALTPVEITLPALVFEIPSPEAAPQVAPLADPIRLPGLPKLRGIAAAPASLVKREALAVFGAQRAETFDWLMKQQEDDGSWGQSLRGTALAVIALQSDPQSNADSVRNTALVAGVRYLTEQKEFAADRQTAQLVACALSGGWAVTRNPNVKVAAERAIVAANSHLSVEAARDWTGLFVDLTPTVAEPKSGHVAAPRPEDELTAACLYLLQTVEAE